MAPTIPAIFLGLGLIAISILFVCGAFTTTRLKEEVNGGPLTGRNSRFLLTFREKTKSCWTLELKNASLFNDTEGTVPYETLGEAKAFCELLGSKCAGVVHLANVFGYHLKCSTEIVQTIHASSWIKGVCKGNEGPNERSSLSSIPGMVNTSVPKGFWVSPFVCNKSSAKLAIATARPIERVWIWGERNSGTTLTHDLLKRNLVAETGNAFPWKHNLIHKNYLRNMESILNVVVVKDAFSWLWSMYRHPHRNENMKALNLESFLFSRWIVSVRRGPFNFKESYRNIFRLRAAKLLAFKTALPCFPYNKIIKYEDFNLDAEKVIRELGEEFKEHGLEVNNPINVSSCVLSRSKCRDEEADSKRQYYIDKKYLENFPHELIPVILMNLDLELEAEFGYNYDYVWTYLNQTKPAAPSVTQTPHFYPLDKEQIVHDGFQPYTTPDRTSFKGIRQAEDVMK